jgi:hypothetical protein
MKRKFVVWWSVEAYVEVEEGQDPIIAAIGEINRLDYTLDEITGQEPVEVRELDEEEWLEAVGEATS